MQLYVLVAQAATQYNQMLQVSGRDSTGHEPQVAIQPAPDCWIQEMKAVPAAYLPTQATLCTDKFKHSDSDTHITQFSGSQLKK